ncbi:MAG TPA: tetratricopeptide repeat protein [Parafilimonas sp.]|jgi:tetratricopeptide (TPR) repeat protein|nr:tetratricopeptide repeat protein [Parafilimonas sp.]
MNTTLEYIESYFQHTLSPDERKSFEQKCEADEEFAREVAFYVTTRQSLREELLEQKHTEWKEGREAENLAAVQDIPSIAPAKRSILRSWSAYAAAACLVLAASVYLFEATPSTQKLAANYVNDNYSEISQQMGADLKDSMALGKSAYNDKQYDKAGQVFDAFGKDHPDISDAKKLAGLSYLKQKNYDAALTQFDELAKMDLHINSGDFLKAVTLLERNNPGDKEEAKKLLQKVIDGQEDGSDKAQEWIKKL